MANRFLIAFGAGLAAGVLFVLPAKGMMAGVWLSILAPMPLMIAVLGYGSLAGLLAALVGALACAAMQPALSMVFLVSTALPALLLGWLAGHPFAHERRLGPGFLMAAVAGLAITAVWGMLAFVAVVHGDMDAAATQMGTSRIRNVSNFPVFARLRPCPHSAEEQQLASALKATNTTAINASTHAAANA
jgi:uncharacterized membrane protein